MSVLPWRLLSAFSGPLLGQKEVTSGHGTLNSRVLAETWSVYTWLFIGFAAIKGQNAASAPL